MAYYMGVDVGSVSTNFVLIDESENVIESIYIRTQGNPIRAVQEGIKMLASRNENNWDVRGVGATGSGRNLAGVIVGADVIKNEITAHAVASLREVPDVQTVIEIGGQDSKIIVLRDGVVTDFAMNTVCAAGTGSFLDQQANRLNIPIEEFGNYALRSKKSSQNCRPVCRFCRIGHGAQAAIGSQAGRYNTGPVRGLGKKLP